jgi:hypothetical protein
MTGSSAGDQGEAIERPCVVLARGANCLPESTVGKCTTCRNIVGGTTSYLVVDVFQHRYLMGRTLLGFSLLWNVQ